jgi:hypothetical protein
MLHSNRTVYKNLLTKMQPHQNYSVSSIATFPIRCTWRCLKLFFYLTLFIFGIITLGMIIFLSIRVTTFLAPVTGIVSNTVSSGNKCLSSPNVEDCFSFLFPVPSKIGRSIAGAISVPKPTTFTFKDIILKEREIFLYYKSECNKSFDIALYDVFSHNDTCCFDGPILTESSFNWDYILFCSWSGNMSDITRCPCEDAPPLQTTTPLLPRARRTRNRLLHSMVHLDPSDVGPS